VTDQTTIDRGAKAEALLLKFAAEAHRRKWAYDRGLDDDGVPIKSEAFDALHRLGEEMRVELEKLRRVAAEAGPADTTRQDSGETQDAVALPVHVGNRVNAEDCPACCASDTPPPYPWICPEAGQPAVGAQQPKEA
jgi:hypothetical protein